jgi:hypothetical protein
MHTDDSVTVRFSRQVRVGRLRFEPGAVADLPRGLVMKLMRLGVAQPCSRERAVQEQYETRGAI